jgi:hypothetical protein
LPGSKPAPKVLLPVFPKRRETSAIPVSIPRQQEPRHEPPQLDRLTAKRLIPGRNSFLGPIQVRREGIPCFTWNIRLAGRASALRRPSRAGASLAAPFPAALPRSGLGPYQNIGSVSV